jgi:hypothetical protein
MKNIVPPSPSPSVPAVPSLSPWPTAKQLRQYTELLDSLCDYCERMERAFDRLVNHPRDSDPLKQAKTVLARYKNSDTHKTLLGDDFKKLSEACVPQDWWENDESNEVCESEVTRMLAEKLVSSYPTANIPDPGIFLKQMVEDVCSWNPHFLVLEEACRKLRQTKKFMPAISELKEAYEAADEEWEGRFGVEDSVESKFNKLTKAVEDGPTWLGDRVVHLYLREYGPGTVERSYYSGERLSFNVRWDDDQRREPVTPWNLVKLKPGDAGFVVAPEVIQRREAAEAAKAAAEAAKAARVQAKAAPLVVGDRVR